MKHCQSSPNWRIYMLKRLFERCALFIREFVSKVWGFGIFIRKFCKMYFCCCNYWMHIIVKIHKTDFNEIWCDILSRRNECSAKYEWRRYIHLESYSKNISKNSVSFLFFAIFTTCYNNNYCYYTIVCSSHVLYNK